MNNFFRTTLEKNTVFLVVIFLLLDLLGVGLYNLFLRDVLDSRFFRLGRDRGYFEVVEYFKMLFMIFMFHRLSRQFSLPLMGAWSILFIVMLIDNAAGLHELIGELLTPLVNLITRDHHLSATFAEIIGFAMLEGLAVLYVIYHYFKSDNASARRFSIGMLVLVAVLAVSSMTVEAFNFSVLEEAIEILGMTILFAFVHIYYRGMNKG